MKKCALCISLLILSSCVLLGQSFDRLEFEIITTRFGLPHKFSVDFESGIAEFNLNKKNRGDSTWRHNEITRLSDSKIISFKKTLDSLNFDNLPDSIAQECCDGSIKKITLFKESQVVKNSFVWAGDFEIHSQLYDIMISHFNGFFKEEEIVQFLDFNDY